MPPRPTGLIVAPRPQGPSVLRTQLALNRRRRVQEHFRFRNDDGTELTATWREAVDTIESAMPIGQRFRLRMAVANRGDIAFGASASEADSKLQFRRNGGAWANVTPLAASAIQAYTCSADGAVTTQQISAGPFSSGLLRDGSQSSNAGLTFNQSTEPEWSCIVNIANVDDLFEFRVITTSTLAPLDDYLVTPAFVATPAESPVTRPVPFKIFPGQLAGPPILTAQEPQDPDVTGPQTQTVAGRVVQVAYGTVAVAAGNANVAVAGRTVQVAYGAVTVAANANLPVAGRIVQVTYGTVTPVAGGATKLVAGRTVQVAYGAVTATEPPEAPSIRALPLKLFPGRLKGPPILTTQRPVETLGQATPVAGRVVQVTYGTVTPVPGGATKLVAGRVVQVAYGASTIVSGNATQAVAGRVVQVAYGTVTALVGGVTKVVAGRVVQVAYGTLTTTAGNATKLVAGRVVQVSYGTITTVAGGATKAVPGRVVQVAYGAVTATPGGGGGPADANWKALIGVGP